MVSSRTATLVLMMAIMCGGSVEAESWKKHQIYRKTRLCNGLDPADFNRDGFMDYVTNFEDTGTIVIVFHPNLQGVRNGWPNVIVGQFDRAESSCAGDMDGDGWCDIAVAHGHEGVGEKAGITVIWNPAQKYKVAESTAWKNSEFIPGSIELGNYLFVRSADINADGVVDLVAGGRQARHATPAYENPDSSIPSVGVIWLEAPAETRFRRDMTKWRVHDIDSDIVSGHGFSLGDIDGDGDLDIVTNCEEYKRLGVEWFENPLK